MQKHIMRLLMAVAFWLIANLVAPWKVGSLAVLAVALAETLTTRGQLVLRFVLVVVHHLIMAALVAVAIMIMVVRLDIDRDSIRVVAAVAEDFILEVVITVDHIHIITLQVVVAVATATVVDHTEAPIALTTVFDLECMAPTAVATATMDIEAQQGDRCDHLDEVEDSVKNSWKSRILLKLWKTLTRISLCLLHWQVCIIKTAASLKSWSQIQSHPTTRVIDSHLSQCSKISLYHSINCFTIFRSDQIAYELILLTKSLNVHNQKQLPFTPTYSTLSLTSS